MSTAIFEAADWVRVSVPKYRIWGVRRCIDDLKVGNAAETAILRLDGSMSSFALFGSTRYRGNGNVL